VNVSGGLGAYLALGGSHAEAQTPLTLLSPQRLGEFLLRQSQTAIIVVAWAAVGTLGSMALMAVRGRSLAAVWNKRPNLTFLTLWAGTGVVLHMLMAPGHSGYVLSYLPALLLLPLAFLRNLPAGEMPKAPTWQPMALLACGIALQCAFFLLLPQGSRAFTGRWRTDTLLNSVLKEPTRSRIEHYDSVIHELVRVIPTRFPAEHTTLLVAAGLERPWYPAVRQMQTLARYYLPNWEQRVLYAGTGREVAEIKGDRFQIHQTQVVEVSSRTKWLVWFSDAEAQPYEFNGSWRRESTAAGVDVVFTGVDPLSPQTWRWGPFSIESRADADR